MPVLTDAERVGTTIGGKYRLDRIVGRGGVGTVFAGVHAWTGREVAVKMLHPEHARDRSVVDRFLTEARASTSLRHPNVVDVLDMGKDDDGSVYLVLEYLEGESLARRLTRRGQLAADETASILLPVMDALAEAHDLAIIHRDIKPENVFIALDAKRRCVPKLLDFGIAKVLAVGSARATRTGTIVGTPAYMSPEQADGTSEVGPAADVWSMGVMFFECLSGVLPFPSDSPTAALVAILTTTAPPLRSVAPVVPASLAAAVDRALARSTSARWTDMRAFAAAISAAVGPAGLQRPDPSGAFRAMAPTEGNADAHVVASSAESQPVAPVRIEASTPQPPLPRTVPITVAMDAPRSPDVATPFAGSDVPAANLVSAGSNRRFVWAVGAIALALVGAFVVSALVLGSDAPAPTAAGSRTSVPVPPAAAPVPTPADPPPPPISPAEPVEAVLPRGVEPPPPEPAHAPRLRPVERGEPASPRVASPPPRSTVPAIERDETPTLAPLPPAPPAEATPPPRRPRPPVEPSRGARDSLILD